MATLVLAEHDGKSIQPASLCALTCAKAFEGPLVVLIAGEDCNAAAEAASRTEGVDRVLLADDSRYANLLAENVALLLKGMADGYSHIVAAATTTGKNVLPRFAALLDVAQISDVIEVISPDTFVHPIYAGNALATVQSMDPVKVLTVRATAFERAAAEGGQATIEPVPAADESGLATFIGQEISKSERPELTAARVIVSGGRGVGSGENFKLIEAVADRLNAAVGASRAAVDAGYVPNDYQVGQTGKIVAPDLYIAIGISGAIQHLAGMKESKVIVAINKDGDAPIFEIADYGLVADLFEALPELAAEIDKQQG